MVRSKKKTTTPVPVLTQKVLEKLSHAKVYCSLSGGADSLALLVFLSEQAEFFSFRLCAVHFEHGFRGEESRADVRFCQAFCAERAIEFKMYSLSVPEHKNKGEGDEEAARRLRLEAWRNIIRDPEKEIVALGHHADDRAENVFLRLFRGANVSGVTSMREVQSLYGITFIRPFLAHTKEELECFLRERQICSWRHDSTNDSTCYGRNFIRLKLLPMIRERFPFAGSGIGQSACTMQEDAQCLEDLASQYFSQFSSQKGLSAEGMRHIHKALRVRVLNLFLLENMPGDFFYQADQSLIREFESLLASGRSEGRISLKECSGSVNFFLVLRDGVFCIDCREKDPSGGEAPSPEFLWDVYEESQCASLCCRILSPEQVKLPCMLNEIYLDADSLVYPLKVRSWKEGDRLIPFGKQHSVALKKLFADQKISGKARKAYPIVCNGGENGAILFVPSLRHSSCAPVQESTRRVLHIFQKTI